ncbi:type IV pilus biogenesis protein PilP [Actimicrobium sp. GrIS 1.19]|uniref:type IV pilus biogenesis protein PilP n=1 Tax=Actimicrobium sp. GrIS 1.19 TaxID=3071708 RepID=UPI002DFD3C65|nr:type IV pilus biogenesis protein PilP [Actimicrobium sp. GrIS 1.19]
MSNRSILLLLPALLVCLGARAESTAEALTRIEAETLVLKAQERQLATRVKILQLQTELSTRQTSADQNARPGAPGDPTTVSIEGIGAGLYATLQFENGSRIDVKTGDLLPNGMRVLSIGANEVIVSADKRQRVRLSPGTAALVSAASGGVQTSLSLPALPPSGYPAVPKLPGKGGAQ